MKSFREQITEVYSKSSGYKNVDNAINTLELSLHAKSNLAKGIGKGLGDGYSKDFDDMADLVRSISVIWQEIKQDVETQK